MTKLMGLVLGHLLGNHVFHLLLEKREKPPRTWVVDE